MDFCEIMRFESGTHACDLKVARMQTLLSVRVLSARARARARAPGPLERVGPPAPTHKSEVRSPGLRARADFPRLLRRVFCDLLCAALKVSRKCALRFMFTA